METIKEPLVYKASSDKTFEDITEPTFLSPQILQIPLPIEVQKYLFEQEERFLEYLNRENPCNLINNDEVEQEYNAHGYFVTTNKGRCAVFLQSGKFSTI